MTVLFLDLDNTLLYSHRHAIPGPKRWVETLNGKPQSFLTERTYQYFKSQQRFQVVPVTTRTPQQFSRLTGLMEDFGWRNALLCNGALLLRDGQEDERWSQASRQCSAEEFPAWEAAYTLARHLAEDIVTIPPFLFYVRTDEAETVLAALQAQTDPERLTLLRDARKVYCFPRSLNKGSALKRYQARFGPLLPIAAGDSAFDLPMLEQAKLSFCPDALTAQLRNPHRIPCQGIFSEEICRGLEALEEHSIDRLFRIP